jgi:hypothetical protein
MRKPWYQRLITSYLLWIIAGFLFVGSFLDAISKGLSWITPSITYIGTILAMVMFLALSIVLPRTRILWVADDGNSVQIKAIGIKPLLMLTGILIALWMPRFLNVSSNSQVLQDNNLDHLAATIVAIENERQSLRATANAFQTQQSITQHPDAYATQTALVDELSKLRATVQVLIKQVPVTQISTTQVPVTQVPITQILELHDFQYYTTNLNQYCYDGPSTSYETHWDFGAGDTVPVFGKWYLDPNWLLVDVNFPDFTRTDCCWVESRKGTLNVSLDEIKSISIVPDRMDCSVIK